VVSPGSWSWRSGGGSGRSETATPRREQKGGGDGGREEGGDRWPVAWSGAGGEALPLPVVPAFVGFTWAHF